MTAIGDVGVRQDVQTSQGATFSLQLRLRRDGVAIDLAGAVFSGSVRRRASSATGAVPFTFSVAAPTTLGEVEVSLTAEQTQALAAGETIQEAGSRYVYALQVELDGVDTPLMWGEFRLRPWAGA
jgi:hypothetical protein